MKTNRIQFQKGMSLDELNEKYGNEQKCESALMDARLPEGFRCPKCTSK